MALVSTAIYRFRYSPNVWFYFRQGPLYFVVILTRISEFYLKQTNLRVRTLLKAFERIEVGCMVICMIVESSAFCLGRGNRKRLVSVLVRGTRLANVAVLRPLCH